jgi:large subunit ribosomal protein L13|tara:strand:+ start:420 stop:827 length:408 start_codon:yes stop_codon:yes gene_type:complete
MVEKIIIDATKASFGRVCSYAAKQALQGNEVVIINSEKAVITGNKKDIIIKYRTLKQKGGHSQKGPKYVNIAYKILKRGIRGMLPDHRKGQGKQAFLRIKCHNGIPSEFKDKEMKKIQGPRHNKYITLKELVEKI